MSDWKQILADCGYPTDVVVIDFETYFDKDYSLKKLSTVEYILDPRFEVTAIARCDWEGLGCEPGNFAGDYLSARQGHYGKNFERATVVAHHAKFDLSILAWKYGIRPPYVVDTMDLSRHRKPGDNRFHKLAVLCEEFSLPQKGDTQQFKGLHLKDILEGGMWGALTDYATNDIQQTYALLSILLPLLSRPEIELPLMQQTLRLYTQPPLKVDIDEADTLIAELASRVDQACAGVGLSIRDVSGNTSFKDALESELHTYGERVPTKPGKKGPIMALAKNDPGLDKLRRHKSSTVRNLIAARSAVKSWPLHIKRIRNLVAQAAPLGMLPVPLTYCGARTGRWAGGERINLQNLPKHNAVAAQIRRLLIPLDGYQFVIADAAQIEARILAWLAGQDDLVEQFRTGVNPYLAFASVIAGRPITADEKDLCQMGKIGRLGCGYGMGPDKCQAFAAQVYKVQIDLRTAIRIVDTYRKQHPRITKLWRDVQQAFGYTTKYHRDSEIEHVRFSWQHDVTRIHLPSGRLLFYPGAYVRHGDIMIPQGKDYRKHQYVWGGFLVENIIQGMSRDHFGEAVLRIENLGYRLALLAHDEAVTLALRGHEEHVQTVVEEELTRPIEWAPDCPLGVKSRIADSYA